MDVAGNRTLHSVLAFHANHTPDKVFITYETPDGAIERYTFHELDEMTNDLAASLLELGLAKGERVNLHLGNRPEFLVTWLAASKAGLSVVPTNPTSAHREWEYVIDHSGARVSFVEEDQADQTDGLLGRKDTKLQYVVVCGRASSKQLAYESLLARGHNQAPRVDVSADDETALMYTSGTTSRPKGVVLTQANYIYAGEAQGRHVCLRPGDRYLVVLPLFHASGQTHSTIPALMFGADIVLVRRFSARKYFDQAITHGATLGSLFAAPIRMILAQPHRHEHERNSMRLALYAQNLTHAQHDEWERRYGVPLIQIWGMTETMALPIMEPVFERRKRMSMGMPIFGYQLRVVDPQGREVNAGTVGELQVRGVPGRTVMKCYLNDPVATSRTIQGEWLHTGDNVFMDDDGYFFFIDRKKDMIKRAGENISAGEVEAVIKEHPHVIDAAVVGVPDAVYDERVKAFVIAKHGQPLTVDEIVMWCQERLANFKVPEFVEFREDFPRTSVGKIQKHLLR